MAERMRHLGAIDADVTPARRDGGIDVRSVYYVAQAKHQPRDFVTVDIIRSLLGAASLEGRTTLFLASGTYSRDSRDPPSGRAWRCSSSGTRRTASYRRIR